MPSVQTVSSTSAPPLDAWVEANVPYLADLSVKPVTYNPPIGTGVARREGNYRDFKVPFLGRLPLYQPIREGGDSGVPLVVSEPNSTAGRAFLALGQRMAAQIAQAALRTAEANKGRIPLIPVR